MTALPGDPGKSHYDQAGDDPKQARTQLVSLRDAVVDIKSYLSGLFGSDGTAATARGQLGLGNIATEDIGEGLEDDGAGNVRVKLDGSTLARGAGGVKVADNAVDLAQLAHQSANTLLGMDGSGNPAAITAGSNITISGGQISGSSSGLTSVSQGDLNTSIGVVSAGSVGTSPTPTFSVLPGGQYGYFPQLRYTTSNGGAGLITDDESHKVSIGRSFTAPAPGGYDSGYATSVRFDEGLTAIDSATTYVQQRYVTASPPFDLGDGECAGFLFLLLNSDGSIAGTYFADAPPWAYNGPTDIRADVIDPDTGRKFRRKRLARLDQVLRGEAVRRAPRITSLKAAVQERAKIIGAPEAARVIPSIGAKTTPKQRKEKIARAAEQMRNIEAAAAAQARAEILNGFEEITHAIKNADMPLIPHPFSPGPGQTVVLADPMNARVAALLAAQEDGEDVSEAIHGGLVTVDNEPLTRAGPPGVMQAALKFKRTGRS